MGSLARSFVDRSVEVRLAGDERLVRTGPNSWGLACWGARRYRPLDAVISDAAGAEPGGFRRTRRDRGRPGLR
jgi:hypothetical protein